MSDNQNRGTADYTKYNAMTTEELEEILRLDAEMPLEQESDTDAILYIMEVLTERKRNSGHTGKTALEAYESFKHNYMMEAENGEAPCKVTAKYKRRTSRWLRGLTAAAAVLAVLFVGSVTAEAFGFDIWETVAQWTQDVFYFGEKANPPANEPVIYTALQEALEKGNVPTWIVPTQVPDGFVFEDIQVQQTPRQKIYTARYTNGERLLRISVRNHIDENTVYAEKSEGMVEEYEVSGITFYLFNNNGQAFAAWLVDAYECYVSGDVTIDNLKMMIKSIKKG